MYVRGHPYLTYDAVAMLGKNLMQDAKQPESTCSHRHIVNVIMLPCVVEAGIASKTGVWKMGKIEYPGCRK